MQHIQHHHTHNYTCWCYYSFFFFFSINFMFYMIVYILFFQKSCQFLGFSKFYQIDFLYQIDLNFHNINGEKQNKTKNQTKNLLCCGFKTRFFVLSVTAVQFIQPTFCVRQFSSKYTHTSFLSLRTQLFTTKLELINLNVLQGKKGKVILFYLFNFRQCSFSCTF